MRVLFLTTWYPTRDHLFGGVFVREHARAAQAAGHDVVVLHLVRVATGRRLWRMEAEQDPALTAGIPTYRLYYRLLGLHGLSLAVGLWAVSRAYRRLAATGFRPSVIHANVLESTSLAAPLAFLTRRPFVVTEHWTGFPQRTLRRVEVWKARWTFRRAAFVLPVCTFLQRAIEDYGIRARFEVIPNAVDTSLFHPAAARLRPRRPPHSPRVAKRILYVGGLDSAHKGFTVLLEALTLLRERRGDWVLDVVGDGRAGAEYERVAAERGWGSFVCFHGARPKTEVAELMRAADLLVLPSRFENLPCVIIEALASGLPVVSTTVGGIPEIVGPDEGVLVPPGDARALADALGGVLDDPARFDRVGIATAAAARFGLPAVGARLTSVYEAVALRGRVV